MIGHTKEPWALEMTEAPVGVPFAAIIAYPDGQYEGIAYITLGEAEANARRIVDCVNALASIPDPAAYVAAFDGMVEALDDVQAQFAFYAINHRDAGKHDKAAVNEKFATLCSEMLAAARLARGGE